MVNAAYLYNIERRYRTWKNDTLGKALGAYFSGARENWTHFLHQGNTGITPKTSRTWRLKRQKKGGRWIQVSTEFIPTPVLLFFTEPIHRVTEKGVLQTLSARFGAGSRPSRSVDKAIIEENHLHAGARYLRDRQQAVALARNCCVITGGTGPDGELKRFTCR